MAYQQTLFKIVIWSKTFLTPRQGVKSLATKINSGLDAFLPIAIGGSELLREGEPRYSGAILL